MSRAAEALFYPSHESWARRAVLGPLSLFAAGYAGVMSARAALYRRGTLAVHKVEGVRVISVGNLTVGGAGKTPAVIELAQRLEGKAKVAVVSRGYGRRSHAPLEIAPGERPEPELTGDEPALIAARTGVPVLVNSDRVAAVTRARDHFGADVVLVDDGFQHLRLHRDLDVLVVDEAVGLGNGRVLPRGPLREPTSALERAGLVWLRTAPRPVPLPPFRAPVVRTRYLAGALIRPEGGAAPLDALAGSRVVALSGIARPSSFLQTLETLGIEPLELFAFADHHRFTGDDLAKVGAVAQALGAQVITTEKDRVRLPSSFPAWTVRLDVEVGEGSEVLDRLLEGR